MSSVTAEWTGDLRFELSSAGGPKLVAAAPSADGVDAAASSPMELVLHALAGCTGIDVVSILLKMKEPLTGLEVRIDSERAEEYPRVYTHLTITYIVRGAVSERKVARAIGLSESTYCSVSAMLKDRVNITSTYQIVP